MSTTIWPSSQNYWYTVGNPQSVMILGQGGSISVGDIVLDNVENEFYVLTDVGTYDSSSQTYTGVTFKKQVFDENILSVLSDQGWKVNTTRSYTNRSSPAFSTSYQPSTTNDTQVVASVALTSTLLTAATVDFQVDSGSGFSTMAVISLSGLAATSTQVINCLVPAGAHYKLISASGSDSITSINEMTL